MDWLGVCCRPLPGDRCIYGNGGREGKALVPVVRRGETPRGALRFRVVREPAAESLLETV